MSVDVSKSKTNLEQDEIVQQIAEIIDEKAMGLDGFRENGRLDEVEPLRKAQDIWELLKDEIGFHVEQDIAEAARSSDLVIVSRETLSDRDISEYQELDDWFETLDWSR